MYRRTLIVAVLVVLVLPISPLATICDLNCRSVTMPAMAMKSSGLSHAVDDASAGAPQHHHGAAHAQRAVVETGVPSTVDLHGQVPTGHQCCYDKDAAGSSSCAASRAIVSQDQIAAPKPGDHPVVVGHQMPRPAVVIQGAIHAPAGEEATATPATRSLTLRI